MAKSVPMITGGMTRLCGGKPGHDATSISAATERCWRAWSRSVIATSSSSERARLDRREQDPKAKQRRTCDEHAVSAAQQRQLVRDRACARDSLGGFDHSAH